MITIWKFPIRIQDEQTIEIPGPHRILSVGLDPAGVPCLWALVNTEKSGGTVRLVIRGTGHPIEGYQDLIYLGHILMPPFVWHVLGYEKDIYPCLRMGERP